MRCGSYCGGNNYIFTVDLKLNIRNAQGIVTSSHALPRLTVDSKKNQKTIRESLVSSERPARAHAFNVEEKGDPVGTPKARPLMFERLPSTDMDSRPYIHQEELLTQGYTIVPGVLTTSEVKELREVVDALYRLHDPSVMSEK